jgi:hypothetical protein
MIRLAREAAHQQVNLARADDSLSAEKDIRLREIAVVFGNLIFKDRVTSPGVPRESEMTR